MTSSEKRRRVDDNATSAISARAKGCDHYGKAYGYQVYWRMSFSLLDRETLYAS
jgi:hypothetical protein